MVLIFHRNKKPVAPQNNARNGMDMEEYQTRIELLCDIAEEAGSITEVTTLLERILKTTRHTIGASSVTLFLNDENKREVYSPLSVTEFEDETDYQVDQVETEIAGIVANNVESVLINNIAADNRFNLKNIKSVNGIRSIIAVPVARGRRVIGVLTAVNNEDGDDFTPRDFEVLKGFGTTEALILLVSMELTAVDNVNKLTLDHALLDGYRSTIQELAAAIDVNDTYGYGHSRRVKDYTLMAAQSLALPPEQLKIFEFGALLHDVGKIGIDPDILSKPGPLTDEEWDIMHEHPQKGADILEDIHYLKEARDIVLHHHERYDGKGYPTRLKGEEIPLGARLVSVANAFDTMTTDHSYRKAIDINDAMRELIESTGTQFCPKAIEAFVSAFKKYNGHLPVNNNSDEKIEKPAKAFETKKAKAKKEPKEDKRPVEDKKVMSGKSDSEISQGNIKLIVPIAVPTEDVKRFGEVLQTIEGVSIVMLSHSEEEGHLFLLSLKKPITLIRFIREIPGVQSVEKKNKDIQVTFRD